jgi:hypothetical protein
MERRNFLGLGALLGLIPLLPKLDITLEDGTKENFTPLNPPTSTSTLQETLDSIFEISVTEFQIPVGHKNQFGRWYQITGKGILNGEIATFKTDKIKEETNAINNPLLIWINETQKAKLISVRSSYEPIFTSNYPYDDDFTQKNFIHGRSETILTCQKI